MAPVSAGCTDQIYGRLRRLRRVHYEGLSKSELSAFRQRIATMTRFEQRKPRGETPLEQLLLHEYRLDPLQMGAPGRLMIAGDLEEVLPVEDAALFDAANPVQKDGTVRLDAVAVKRRKPRS